MVQGENLDAVPLTERLSLALNAQNKGAGAKCRLSGRVGACLALKQQFV